MFGCHLRLRPVNSVPLLRTPETRRTVARVLLERGRDFELTSFSAAESHLHAHNGGDRAATMELGRRVEIALTRRLPDVTGFYPAYVEPVRDESHLYNTCRYILRQDERHNLRVDPLREASNLPDLLGMRLLGGYTAATVQRWLPSLGGHELLKIFGLARLEPVRPDLQRTVEAGVLAAGLASLQGRSREHQELKRALIALLGDYGTSKVAAALSLHPSNVRRLRRLREPIDKNLLRAIRRQDALLDAKAEALATLEAPLPIDDKPR